MRDKKGEWKPNLGGLIGPSRQPRKIGGKFIPVVAILALVLVTGLWLATDHVVVSGTTVAVIYEKRHVPATATYIRTETRTGGSIGRSEVPETFILGLRVLDKNVDVFVNASLYGSVEPGQRMEVEYERRNVAGLRVVLAGPVIR
jgi:hypothetical protein